MIIPDMTKNQRLFPTKSNNLFLPHRHGRKSQTFLTIGVNGMMRRKLLVTIMAVNMLTSTPIPSVRANPITMAPPNILLPNQ